MMKLTLLLPFVLAASNPVSGESCLDSYEDYDFPDDCTKAIRVIRRDFRAMSPPCGHSFFKELKMLTEASDIDAARAKIIEACESRKEAEDQEAYDRLRQMFPIELDGTCTSAFVVDTLSEMCDCNAGEALMEFMELDTEDALKQKLDAMCSGAWGSVENKDWTTINGDFDNEFMEEFFDGETVLNTETSNLATPETRRYPTSPESRAYGESINEFYLTQLQEGALKSVQSMGSCQSNAMMCCWGRDRQSGDNNGNCRARRCDDRDPADNSNLCSVAGEDEGDIHCHGVAWSNDPNDVSSVFKFNNLFYVSMYDHLYSRGYVENVLGSNFDETGVPMCDCIENMPKVSRADCTEIDADIIFTMDLEGNSASITAGDLNGIDFDACDGINVRTGRPRGADNDLASYVNRLVREDKIEASTQTDIHSILLGYASPNNNENEEVCNPDVI